MMSRKMYLAAGALVLGLVLAAGALMAGHRIIDDIEIEETPACAEVKIVFSFPVRYVKHFPYDSGTDLRIQLEPIRISELDKESLYTRETLQPPPNDIAQLEEVVFEGDIEGGPFLTLYFRMPVEYKVGQGADFRSLNVTVKGPEAAQACQPGR